MASTIVDKCIQGIYYLLFRLMLCYCFLVRPHYYGAYVGVWWQGKILIIKNSYKKNYTVPCGVIGRKEKPIDAAVRELGEEVAIALYPEQLRLAEQFTINQEFKHDHISFFEINLDQKPQFQVDNREVVHAQFMTVEEAGQLPLSPVVIHYFSLKSLP